MTRKLGPPMSQMAQVWLRLAGRGELQDAELQDAELQDAELQDAEADAGQGGA